MDKYLIRTPREPVVRKPAEEPKKAVKQATIESLQGVVVIEDIQRMKAKLTLKDQRPEAMVECLTSLSKKIPCKEVMMSTQIGRVVNKLRKHSDADVAQAARSLYHKWRTHFETERDRPQIEVSFDKKSEKMRSSCRRFISEALKLEADKTLAEVIEREMLHKCQRSLGLRYRQSSRKLIFALRGQEQLRASVLSGHLSPEALVKQFLK